MAANIILKRSAVPGRIPSTTDLNLGEVAINTADGKMYIKQAADGAEAIVEIGGLNSGLWKEYIYTLSAGQTSISGADNNGDILRYLPNYVQVHLNGILLQEGVDFTASSGLTITLVEPAELNDILTVSAFSQVIGEGDISVETFTGNGSTVAFTLATDPVTIHNTTIFIDGVYQEKAGYTLANSVITFSEAPATGTSIEVLLGTKVVSRLDLEGLNLSTVTADSFQFNGGSGDAGTLSWNTEDETLDLIVSPDVTYQLGQELGVVARNLSGTTLANGAVVRVTGASGDKVTVDLADSSTENGSAPTIGVVTETIGNNSTGRITTAGLVRGLNTSSYSEGVAIYLGTSGTFTSVKPASPNHLVHIGWVVRSHATEGAILVHVNNGWELDELHDVLISDIADNDVLQWNNTTGVWENKTIAAAGLATPSDISTAISNLIDTAPTTLDTLNELAAALGDDPNFATTVTNSIADKVAKAGDTMTGDLSFGDSVKAKFGASSDLQIWHDGSNSLIQDAGTGDLLIRADNLRLGNADGTEQYILADSNGAVQLRYDGATKLATTSTGVDVTGTVTADGLEVDGSIKLDGDYPTSSNNSALGANALDSVTTGTRNTAIGSSALTTLTTTSYNTAVGYAAGLSNTATNLTAFGARAAGGNTTGADNTALGMQALYISTTGSNNTAVGKNAMYYNTTASNNTAVGFESLFRNTIGAYNTAVGSQAGLNISTGSYNVLLGRDAGVSQTTASYNTIVGDSAGYSISTGSKNTIIGRFTGNQDGLDIRTSSNQVVISDGDGQIAFHKGLVSTLATTTQQSIYMFDSGITKAAKVVISADNGTDTYVTEMLIAINTAETTITATEYGQVSTGTLTVAYDVDISGGNARILATPASSTLTYFKVSIQLL